MKIKFVMQVLLDINWPDLDIPGTERESCFDKDWVRRRILLFEKYTLRSILNQRFEDFDIWLLCGTKYRDLTEGRKWHERIKLLYDFGEEEMSGIKDNYLVIVRLDSDDLYHQDVMREISNNLILTDRRGCLIYRENYLWDHMNKCIRRIHRQSPAFYTHIFPRKIYRDWKEFKRQHHIIHEKAGGRVRGTRQLSNYRACVVRHEDGHGFLRYGINPDNYVSKEKLAELQSWERATCDPQKMANILRPFGVKYE